MFALTSIAELGIDLDKYDLSSPKFPADALLLSIDIVHSCSSDFSSMVESALTGTL